MSDFNKLKNGILGFIIGDALGVPLEFKKRELFKNNKVTDMILVVIELVQKVFGLMIVVWLLLQ